MILKVLFILRKGSLGEMGPEALAVVDECTHEQNPECFDERCREELNQVAEEAIKGKCVVELSVPGKRIRALLEKPLVMQAEIVEEVK